MTASRPKKIGLFGGSFNPIHFGHLRLAQTALESLALDEVVFIPSGRHPRRNKKEMLGAELRLVMVKIAIASTPGFSCSDVEIRRPGRSYTIDTVRHLKQRYSEDTRFYLILGEDCGSQLMGWKGIDELQELVTFVIAERPGVRPNALPLPATRICMPATDVSSTLIRDKIRQEQSIQYLTPLAVVDLIESKGLYKDPIVTLELRSGLKYGELRNGNA